MWHKVGFLVLLGLFFAGVGCKTKETKVAKLQLTEADMFLRRALVDRFDLLTQAEGLHYALAMVDSLERLETVPDWLVWCRFDIKGKLAELNGNYDQALFEINQLLRFFEEREAGESMLMEAYFRRGDILIQMRQYDLAFEDFFRGMGDGNASKDACLNANFYYRLGMVSYRQSNFNESIQYFKRSIALFDSCGDKYAAKYREQEVASNIGLCYWRLQKYDSSLVWYGTALMVIGDLPIRGLPDEARARVARWVSYGNKGAALYESGNFKAGKKFMYASYESNLDHAYGDKGHAVFVGNTLAAYLIREKKLDEAAAIIKRLDSSTALRPNSPALLSALLNKINFFAASGQNDSIWPYFRLYTLVADSIKQYDRKLIKLNTTLLLRGLDKDYALRAEQQKSEARLYLNRAILGLLLLGLTVLVGVFVTLKRSRRQNQQLETLNEQIKDQNTVLAATFDRLKYANEELQLLNQQQSGLLRVVAHDLRNPLAAVHSMGLMKLEEPDQDNENLDFYQLAVKACRGGLDLINDLLESVEIQQHEGRKVTFTRVWLHEFLEDTRRLVQHYALEKDIQLHFGLVDPSWEVELDVERFRRALINLITNAIKFSTRGGTVQVLCALHPKGLQLEVIDHGIGIAQEDMPKLFERFTPVKRPGTEGEKAFGLGLSITQHLLQMHQSEIEVESKHGEGATFRVILPEQLLHNGLEANYPKW